MRNLQKYITDQYGMEALCLLREWEKPQNKGQQLQESSDSHA